MKKTIYFFLFVFVITLPVAIRILNINPNRIHGDDMIVAYLSAHYDFQNTNFFSAIPKNIVDWVCQFPTITFIVQKLFFLVFGANLYTVPLSYVPYVLIVSIFLYLTAREIFDKNTALISVVLYSFFSPALYLETVGLQFVTSTASFLVFFYFSVLHFKKTDARIMIFIGFSLACCFLFYASSYIALPILFVFFVMEIALKKDKLTILGHYFFAIFIFFLVLSPFIIFMIKTHNFYLFGRVTQVSLVNAKSLLSIKDNLFASINGLYFDGIGGFGGSNFGHLALFDKFTFFFLLCGIVSSIFLLFKKKYLIIPALITVIASFIVGVVLTVPPPAYHRFSVAFPFLMIIVSTFFYVLSILKINRLFKNAIFIILIFVFLFANYQYFLMEKINENNAVEIQLAKYIHSEFPQRNLYVASFPGYNFEKIFYFVENGERKKIKTDYHANFLNSFNQREKYVYVIIFPTEFDRKFQEKDPLGKIINFSSQYSLFVN